MSIISKILEKENEIDSIFSDSDILENLEEISNLVHAIDDDVATSKGITSGWASEEIQEYYDAIKKVIHLSNITFRDKIIEPFNGFCENCDIPFIRCTFIKCPDCGMPIIPDPKEEGG